MMKIQQRIQVPNDLHLFKNILVHSYEAFHTTTF